MNPLPTCALTAALLLTSTPSPASDDARADAMNDLLVVMGYVRTSLGMADTCIALAPGTAEQTRASRAAWRDANAEVLRYLESAFERAIDDQAGHDAAYARTLRDRHEREFERLNTQSRAEIEAAPETAADRCDDYRRVAAHSQLVRDFATWLDGAKRVYPLLGDSRESP